jgi:hypothetical protein
MGTCVLFGLRAIASSVWAFAGATKLLAPAPAKLGDFDIGVPFMVLLGALELGISVAWWVVCCRRRVINLSLWIASLFALATITGVVDPRTCACFGRLQVEKARHLMMLAAIIVASAATALLDKNDAKS